MLSSMDEILVIWIGLSLWLGKAHLCLNVLGGPDHGGTKTGFSPYSSGFNSGLISFPRLGPVNSLSWDLGPLTSLKQNHLRACVCAQLCV